MEKKTREILKKRKILPLNIGKKDTRYTKNLLFNKGYETLQNLGIVTKYIKWTYKVTPETLHLILFLYPKTAFTKNDIYLFPLRWGNSRVNDLVKDDILSVVEGTKSPIVYGLSYKGKKIVKEFHKLMSGEMEMPNETTKKSVFKDDATYSEKKARDLIRKMSEEKKKLF